MTTMLTSPTKFKKVCRAAGSHWFSPATMRFFNTEVLTWRMLPDGHALFVTSERYSLSHERRYSLRFAHQDGRVETLGPFGAYATIEDANAGLARCFDLYNGPETIISHREAF